MIAMRGLGDPDALPSGTSVYAWQLNRLAGLPRDRRMLTARSQRWRPWRSYATQHLWTALDHPVHRWPAQETA
ncbi:ada regulatory alkA domain protein [Mycobacterium xenopi 3993]|nr:ada regulatory alkA domain protein [Mycobacterium xenopi 3993]